MWNTFRWKLDVFDYDEDNLICYDMSVYYSEGKKRDKQFYHTIISKQDGSITRSISIPFVVVKAPYVQNGDGIAVASVCPIVPYKGDWLLIETSSDTIYCYKPQENALHSFFMKTPSKDPEVLVTMGTITDRYYFMQTIEEVFDFTTRRGSPNTELMYDKQEDAVFEPIVLSSDYAKEQKVNMVMHPINNKIASFQILPANQLVEAYENNELKGKIKEIAAKLNEESNPVVLVMKYKGAE